MSYLALREWRRFVPSSGNTLPTGLTAKPVIDLSDIEAIRETAVSKDGTNVPLTVFRRKGIKLDGGRPVIVTGYGGFNVSLTPNYVATLRCCLTKELCMRLRTCGAAASLARSGTNRAA